MYFICLFHFALLVIFLIWFCTVSEVRSQNANPKFSEDEEMLIARMFSLVGERFGVIPLIGLSVCYRFRYHVLCFWRQSNNKVRKYSYHSVFIFHVKIILNFRKHLQLS